MKQFETFYGPERLLRLKKQNRRGRLLLVLLFALAMGLCVALCFGVDPVNVRRRLLLCVAVWTAWGWGALLALHFGLRRLRAEAAHAAWVAAEEKTRAEGALRLQGEAPPLRGGVPMRLLSLETGQRTRVLKVHGDLAPALSSAEGRRVALTLAGGYVADCEVCDEDA